MDCGIPFCHQGCPLGNLIPDWNDFVYRDRWHAAIDRLHATNNFPEFTGRLCPAPCEGSCVLGINNDPVTIKAIEVSIIDRAFDEGWVTARPPADPHRQARRGRRIGPRRPGRRGSVEPRRPPRHRARARRPHRRPAALRHSGVQAGKAVPRSPPRADARGRRRVPNQLQRRRRRAGRRAAARFRRRGPRRRRRPRRAICRSPAASSSGIHFAMEYLTESNKRCEGDAVAALDDPRAITAKDKHVIIIGGGDTGADCLGTAHRQGARGVHQLELLSRPPDDARAGTTRGRRGRTSSACRPRTKKAASGSTPSRPSASPATPKAA